MTVLLRSVILILVLYCAEQCRCNGVSPNSESVSPPLSDPSDLNTVNDNVNDDENRQRTERETTTAQDGTNSDDESIGRSARCLLGSARHLRKHDADQVAKYFINGGPLNGFSHFVGAARREYDTDNDEESNIPQRENCDKESTKENQKTESNDPVVGAPRIPTFYVPHSAAIHQNHLIHPYNSIVPGLRPIPLPRASTRRLYPALPPAYSHPEAYLYGYERSALPNSLLRAATLPARGLMRARHLLNNLIPVEPSYQYALNDHVVGSTYIAPEKGASETSSTRASKYPDIHYSPILGAANPVYELRDVNGRNKPKALTPARAETVVPGMVPSYDPAYSLHPSSVLDLFHPQPSGYIVRLVPNVTPPPPSEQTVSSVQQESSNCTEKDEPIVGAAKMSGTEKPETITSCNESKKSQDEEQDKQPNDNEKKNECQNLEKECKSEEEAPNSVEKVSKRSISNTKPITAPIAKESS